MHGVPSGAPRQAEPHSFQFPPACSHWAASIEPGNGGGSKGGDGGGRAGGSGNATGDSAGGKEGGSETGEGTVEGDGTLG